MSFGSLSAQKVKLKDGKILIDKQEVLSYEMKSYKTEFVVYELGTKNELFTAIYFDTGTKEDRTDDYIKVTFTASGKSFETSKAYFRKYLIKWFIEQGVLNLDGTLNEDKIDAFIKKYDENISKRTIITK